MDRYFPLTIQPSDHVWALVSGLASPDRERRLMGILQAYIDDSGRGAPPVYVLAGWISDSARWASFANEWAAALREPPLINYFKMKEAASCQGGEFMGWQNEARDRKLVRLASVIRDHAMVGIGFAVKHTDWELAVKRRVKNIPVMGKQLKEPYFFACYGLMIQFIKMQRDLGISQPVDFIFDEQQKLSAYVDESYDHLKALSAECHPLIGDRPSHKDDKKILPLQAADLFAWHVRRYFEDEIEQKPPHITAARPILETIPQIGTVWGPDHLDEAISAVFGRHPDFESP